MISETLIVLKNRIAEITKKPVYIVNNKLAAVDKGVIYIVAPRGVDTIPFIGTGFMVSYDIHIYEVVHRTDVSRQKDIGDNVNMALDACGDSIGRVFEFMKGYRRIAGANFDDAKFYINTWVVNTTVYTSYNIDVSIKTIKDA